MKNKIGKMSPKKDIGQKIVGCIYGEIQDNNRSSKLKELSKKISLLSMDNPFISYLH